MNSGGFGSFGSPSGFNTAPSLFGASTQNNNQTLRPGGLFGSTATSNAPTLGATSTQPTSLFSNAAASPFSFVAGQQPNQQTQQVLQQPQQAGTGHIKFVPLAGNDTVTKGGVQSTINTLHQCITAMKEYESKSLEELRLEDYQANRKFPTAVTSSSGFGGGLFSTAASSSSGFGGTSTSGGGSLFGSTSGVANKPLMFGAAPTATTQPATNSLFGGAAQNPANRSFFGAPNTTQAATGTTTGFSGFGAPSTTTNTFGTAQPQTSIFGGLGQNNTTTGGGLFGSGATTSGTTGGLFSQAQPANKPVFSSFGTTNTTAPATNQPQFSFGQTGTTTTTASTPSIFGQAQTQSPLSANRGAFGGFGTTAAATTTTAFGASTTNQPATSIFGSTTQNRPAFGGGLGSTTTNTGTTGFGGFGTTNTTSTTPQTNIFGGFGQQTAQPATNTTTTAANPLFGTTLTSGGGGLGTSAFGTGTTPSTSIFGTTTQPQQTGATTTGGIFGNATNTGFATNTALGAGGFGTTTNTSQPSLFGSTTTGGGLFGGANTTTQPASQFGINTGTATTTTTSGLGNLSGFNLNAPNNNALGFGLNIGGGLNQTQNQLNLQQQQQQQQQQLQLQQQQQQQQQQLQQQQLITLSNSPYGSSSLLKSTLQDLTKREDILKPLSPIAQRQYIAEATSPPKVTAIAPPASANSSMTSDFKGGLSQTIKITPTPKVLSSISMNRSGNLFEGLEEEETPCFVPRRNIKKLLFRPSAEHNSSRRASGSGSVSGDSVKKQNFQIGDESIKFGSNISGNGVGLNTNLNNPQNNPGAYGSSFTSANLITQDNISDDGQPNSTHNNGDNHSEISSCNSMHQNPANITLERPGYFTIPSMQDLAAIYDAKTGDCIVDNFSIGRVDYGCITFPGATNLAGINLDELVHIRRKEVHVYPDDSRKPPVGQGLNKPAEITLHRIWPLDKQTKLPITEPNRVIEMGYNKKIERATLEMGAQFIDYDPVTGSWSFKVKHFSKYGLKDSDDEDQEDAIHNPNLNQLGGSKIIKKIQAAKLETASDQETTKREKEMIEKQLKLIEMRRLELMQHRKGSIGSNLNSITNQQWELINEYNVVVPPSTSSNNNNQKPGSSSNKYVDRSHIHLELSTDSAEQDDESDELEVDDGESVLDDEQQQKFAGSKKSSKSSRIRKALILENENENETDDNTDLTDENKENKSSLYPSLSALKSKNSARKSGATSRLYPNLSDFDPSMKMAIDGFRSRESQNFGMNYDEDKASIKMVRDGAMESHLNDQQQMDDQLPFVSGNERLMGNLRDSRKLTEAFFNEDEENEGYSNRNEIEETKYSGFNQKPITFGLLKRGLGGISNLNQNKLTIGDSGTLSSSMKGDQFHGETKVSKFSAYCAPWINMQKIAGPVVLKPKLWNRLVFQKSSKPTKDLHTNSDRLKTLNLNLNEPPESDVVENRFIKLKDSITNDLNWCIADSGLFNSRRFRVNWSLNSSASTFTRLNYLPSHNLSFANSIQLVSVHRNLLQTNVTDVRLNKLIENCELYLNIQLELTDFVKQKIPGSKAKLPLLRPKLGNELIRRCFECTQDIRNNIGDHPDADNVDHMKMVWNLCQNLWGDIPESLKSNPNDSSLSSYELEQIRKRLLGEWLSDVSSHRIDKECKYTKYNKSKDGYLGSIFSLLTGNRLLDACNLAVENEDFRLAMLISQSSGGNDTVRGMIRKQLNEWSMSNAHKFINPERIKLYILIAGELVQNITNNNLVNVCENLDWKRQFAINLWYQSLPINSIKDALIAFEKCTQTEISNQPVPSYIEDSVPKSLDTSLMPNRSHISQSGLLNSSTSSRQNEINQQIKNNPKQLVDTCFHLIKLYCDSTYSIEDTIAPLNHTSNQLDFRLSWHLAMALYALEYRHVQKSCLETLHDSFATQLQSMGLWNWSIFVLMHIENENRRETYVKKYLSKHVTSQSELNEKETFLIEKLNVPAEWIYELKALRAKYEHSHESQLKLLMKAHKWNEAHTILIEILAPDLFIKRNFKTLNEYLNTLSKEKESISKWNVGGQIYLDFIRLNQKADALFTFSQEESQEKLLNDEYYREIDDQLINLSARLKEFDIKNNKKLLCTLTMSKMLLKFFNAFNELNNCSNDDDEEIMGDDQLAAGMSTKLKTTDKLLTKSIVEKASQQTESVPDHDLIGTMLMKKSKYTHDCLMSKNRH